MPPSECPCHEPLVPGHRCWATEAATIDDLRVMNAGLESSLQRAMTRIAELEQAAAEMQRNFVEADSIARDLRAKNDRLERVAEALCDQFDALRARSLGIESEWLALRTALSALPAGEGVPKREGWSCIMCEQADPKPGRVHLRFGDDLGRYACWPAGRIEALPAGKGTRPLGAPCAPGTPAYAALIQYEIARFGLATNDDVVRVVSKLMVDAFKGGERHRRESPMVCASCEGTKAGAEYAYAEGRLRLDAADERSDEIAALRKVAEAARASLRIWERNTQEWNAVRDALAALENTPPCASKTSGPNSESRSPEGRAAEDGPSSGSQSGLAGPSGFASSTISTPSSPESIDPRAADCLSRLLAEVRAAEREARIADRNDDALDATKTPDACPGGDVGIMGGKHTSHASRGAGRDRQRDTRDGGERPASLSRSQAKRIAIQSGQPPAAGEPVLAPGEGEGMEVMGCCDDCGQPMLPPGEKKRPNQYDHASGCPQAVRITEAQRRALVNMANGWSASKGLRRRSELGGLQRTLYSLRRKGLIAWAKRPPFGWDITDAGRRRAAAESLRPPQPAKEER